MVEFKYDLGEKVRDITGFCGIITERVEEIGGQVSYGVAPIVPDFAHPTGEAIRGVMLKEERLAPFSEPVTPLKSSSNLK